MRAVASVQAQQPAPNEVILVVDHNPELLARLAEALPGVRVVPNTSERGSSGARNTGVALATGEIVAFLDDDAVAQPGWLAALTSPLCRPRRDGCWRAHNTWMGHEPPPVVAVRIRLGNRLRLYRTAAGNRPQPAWRQRFVPPRRIRERRIPASNRAVGS